MKLRIDHIAKIEGHASFTADIVSGDIRSAKIKIEEGARLFEGGRGKDDQPKSNDEWDTQIGQSIPAQKSTQCYR